MLLKVGFVYFSKTTFPTVSHTLARQHSIWTILSVQVHEHKRTGSPQKRCHLPRLKSSTTFSSCPPSECKTFKQRARPQAPPCSVTPQTVSPENSAPCPLHPGVEYHCLPCSITTCLQWMVYGGVTSQAWCTCLMWRWCTYSNSFWLFKTISTTCWLETCGFTKL